MKATTHALTPRLLSIDTSATLLGVSPRFLRLLVARGQIKITRMGRRTLVPREEVDRLAAEGTAQLRGLPAT
jgi:excisionase family DNA binding protein